MALPPGGQAHGFHSEERRRLVLPVLLSRPETTFALGKVSEDEARAKSSQVDYLLMRLKQRLIDLPPGVEIVGLSAMTASRPLHLLTPDPPLCLRKQERWRVLRDRFLARIPIRLYTTNRFEYNSSVFPRIFRILCNFFPSLICRFPLCQS